MNVKRANKAYLVWLFAWFCREGDNGTAAFAPSSSILPRRRPRPSDGQSVNNNMKDHSKGFKVRHPSQAAVSISPIEESSVATTAETSSRRRPSFPNEKDMDEWLDSLSPTQIEREIVKLGRKGRIQQALDIYNSLEQPLIRQVNAIIDACSRARPVRLDLAFEILRKAPVQPNVYTFGSLMSVCARAGNVKHAVDLLSSMERDHGVAPNAVVYNTAVSACGKADPPRPDIALQLLEQAKERGLRMSVVGYNAAISAAANAGDWKGAVDLLTQMEHAQEEGCSGHDAMVPRPDAVSYGTVLSAFERGQEWGRILEYADYMESQGLVLDGLAITSVLHACQSLGLADEAVRYINMMKENRSNNPPRRRTAGWEMAGVRTPLKGPDAVAYLLAVSACARGGSWLQGIQLLNEYCKDTPSVRNPEVDVNIFTAAIKGCEYEGQWQEAFLVLNSMRKNKVEPSHVAFAAVIGACTAACAKQHAHRPDDTDIDKKDDGSDDSGKNSANFESLQAMKKAMRLINVMSKDETIVSPNTLVYNAAIRTCAEAHELQRAFKLYNAMRAEDGPDTQPNIVTFGCLMTACERVGSTEGVSKVFSWMREADMEPNNVIYGAAISSCRKAGEEERALLLLKKMMEEGMRPNTATFNTVLRAQAESRNTRNLARVYKKLWSDRGVGHDEDEGFSHAAPNRQTFNIVIRSFAENKQPREAESVLQDMTESGCVPDVDLYTLVVSAYERTGQPLQALRLMDSMTAHGYAFYQDRVLNAAFKRALKMANMVGKRWSSSPADGIDKSWSLLDDGDAVDVDEFFER